MVYFKLRNIVGYRPLRPIKCSYLFEMILLDMGHVSLVIGAKKYFVITIEHLTRWVKIRAIRAENF